MLLVVLLLCAGLLGGCSWLKRSGSWFGGLLPIQATIASDANRDSALAVDLVLIYDPALIDPLLELSARQWFAGKEQLLKDQAEALQVEHWEWVPGQDIDELTVQYRLGVETAVFFADYSTAGEHRVQIDPARRQRLDLGTDTLSVQEIK